MPPVRAGPQSPSRKGKDFWSFPSLFCKLNRRGCAGILFFRRLPLGNLHVIPGYLCLVAALVTRQAVRQSCLAPTVPIFASLETLVVLAGLVADFVDVFPDGLIVFEFLFGRSAAPSELFTSAFITFLLSCGDKTPLPAAG